MANGKEMVMRVVAATLLLVVACAGYVLAAAARRETRDLRVKIARKLVTFQVTGCTLDLRKEELDLGLLVPTYSEDDLILD
jgi:hypothetical protein